MKKSLAVMLALIMVLCMIPTTALAKDMSWTWTVTIFGGNYYRANGTETTTNKYTINRHLDNSVDHEIGYKFEWNASAGGNNYKGGWQLCLTVDGKIVERSTAYIYEKDMSSASGSWTAPKSSHTGNSSHPFNLYLSNYPARFQNITLTYDANEGSGAPGPETKKVEIGKSATFTVSTMEPTRENYTFKGWSTNKNATTAEYKGGDSITINENTTLYAVWEENNPTPPTPPTTDKPNPPADIKELVGSSNIQVQCTTANTTHPIESYSLLDESYTTGTVTKDGDAYTCTITVDPAKYVTEYNKTHGDHALDPNPQSRSITFEWKNNSWALAAGQNLPIIFTVIHNTQEPPKPDKPNLPADIIKELVGSGNIKVKCTTANTTHPIESYSLLDESYTTGTVTKDGDAYTCTITVDPAKYVTEYNKTHGDHALDPNPQSGSITFKWENDEWTLLAGQNLPITFTVVHDTQEPPTPGPSENPNPSPSTDPKPTPTPTPGGGNGGGGHSHYYPTTTPVPVIVIPPKTGDMTIWQSILHFLGIR